MARFSANLGLLWRELALPDAIRAAARAGFDAVECHWPYDVEPQRVRDALADAGLSMLGLNTIRGKVEDGEAGLAALAGREADARAAIDQAIDYAIAIGAQNVHVMAGNAEGAAARQAFLSNLAYASARAAVHGITILIEPLNRRDWPGYFLSTTDQAAEIIGAVGAANLRLMFDCYHVQISEGDLTRRLQALMPIIGHIQIAGVPERGRPDRGEVNYRHIIDVLETLGYNWPIGAEYHPGGRTEDGLDWIAALR
ncbi:hydroxypyruvate isomerase family protein [Rhizobium sp. C4]|uniref:hydroxypyruvate isomerase family protein n=1 Tax=Rhizobium sp. C4 TaxID=1349800 RepID=UPI001E583306|nr:TIM barrel protein [Rhizobium sp. C4]MCD2176165.1 TIM barrel protein [Rhizobium sp. C4]